MADPKSTIRSRIETILVLEDDGLTNAAHVYLFKGGPETPVGLFGTYDVVTTIEDPVVRSTRDIQDVPEHYPARYPVHVLIIDKTGLTATKLIHKMREAVRAQIEANAQGAGYTLKILEERSNNRRVGGLEIWQVTFFIEYKDT